MAFCENPPPPISDDDDDVDDDLNPITPQQWVSV